MKRILICLTAAAVLTAAFAGCSPASPDHGETPSQASSQPQGASLEGSQPQGKGSAPGSGEISQPQPPSQAAPGTVPPAALPEASSSSQPSEGSSAAGTYVPQEDLGAIGLSLSLGEDGRYTLTISAFLLSGTVSGGYTVEGDSVTLVAEQASLPGYSAENVGNFDLTLQEDGSLFYRCGDFVSQVGIHQESITFVKE